ncbi:hypothetical protein ACFLV5_03055 [Chloroflexota bacterium]
MAWVKLNRLLALLRQRRIDPRGITIFVDDHLINPRYRRPFQDDADFEEDDELSDDESEED